MLVLLIQQFVEYKVMENRIKDIRKQLGLTQAQLAEKAETSTQQIQYLESGQRKLTLEWMERLGRALDVSPWNLVEDYHSNETRSSNIELDLIKVIGETQAGVWKEALEWDTDERYEIPFVVNPKFNNSAYGLKIAGDSMNLVYPEGTVVIVVPIYNYVGTIESGKRVIVERSKKDGIVEATAKELEIIDGIAKLWPRSTNPKFQQSIDIAWPYESPQEMGLETVEIKGIIVGSYRTEE